MLKRIVVAISCYLVAFIVSASSVKPTTTVLISIDGFANRYLSQYQPKTLSLLAKLGVKADALLPSFPTKTFPNHLTMMTGKKPFQHGVFLNQFYDKGFNDTYRYGSSRQPRQWLKFPPIWSLLEQRNIKTAILFFPESTTPYLGVLPSYSMPYDENWSDSKRFEQLYHWLTLPSEQRPQLLAGYFSSVDKAGHRYGTRSPELAHAITNFDQALANFLNKIEQLAFEVNLILVSDHGMVDIKNIIATEELLASVDLSNTVVTNSGTQLIFYNKDQLQIESIQESLRRIEDRRFTLYSKDNYPSSWQVPSNGKFVPDIILNAHIPFVFEGENDYVDKANHGFELTENTDLEALFIATGPRFSRQKNVRAFDNTMVFSLLSRLYGVEQPNITTEQNALLSELLMQ